MHTRDKNKKCICALRKNENKIKYRKNRRNKQITIYNNCVSRYLQQHLESFVTRATGRAAGLNFFVNDRYRGSDRIEVFRDGRDKVITAE